MGSADLARSIIRIGALTAAAFCLAVWAAATLQYASGGAPVIDGFYATAILLRYLGGTAIASLLILLAVGLLLLAAREIWRLKLRGLMTGRAPVLTPGTNAQIK